MRKILCSKKYSGILWAVVIAGVFVMVSLLGMQFFQGTDWYIFSSALRIIFGFIILFVIRKIYKKTSREVLSPKKSSAALIAGSGFIVYFIFYLLVWSSGIKAVTEMTIGLLFSRIILQQAATGFYEELNYRVLILEGYFYGNKNVSSKLVYAFASFLLFGSVHVVTGWSLYTFLQTGTIGFAFAVMYMKSGNILIPMILHFVYDIFANLTSYIEWNNSPLFVSLNSLFEIPLIIMFVLSILILLKKEKPDTSL